VRCVLSGASAELFTLCIGTSNGANDEEDHRKLISLDPPLFLGWSAYATFPSSWHFVDPPRVVEAADA